MIGRARQCKKHELVFSGKECPECKKARMRNWRERNRTHVARYNRDHYQSQLEWKRRHPERAKEHQRRYNQSVRGRPQHAYEQRNKQTQLERRRRWKRTNFLKVREYSRRRYQWKAASGVKVDYNAILMRYGWVCHLCDRPIAEKEELHFDHVIPLSKGGSHTEDNIKPAHALCNWSKNNREGVSSWLLP